MSVPVISFFSTKGGVGKTFLTYHTAWMLAELGYRVLMADLDPQSNLSAACLTEDRLIELSQQNRRSSTIYGAVVPLSSGIEDVRAPWLETVASNLSLIPGDIALFDFERDLSQAWYRCMVNDRRALYVLSAFARVLQKGATQCAADVVLMDLAPNLGAINRAALIAVDSVVIPVGPDLFSIQGLQILGTGLRSLREEWRECLARHPNFEVTLPEGRMNPIGYAVMNQSARHGRMPLSYQAWATRIPAAYRQYVIGQNDAPDVSTNDEENCLSVIKQYHSLMPMAQEARKPMFDLKPSDGALGALSKATQDAYHDFKQLAVKIIQRAGLQKRS